jgi:N-acetylglutamate synthase and related acetyltransferases
MNNPLPETFRHGAYEIVDASKRHLPFIPKIELAAATLFSPDVLPEGGADATVPLADLALAMDEKRLWVALLGEDVVGFLLMKRMGENHLLAEVDVLPEHGGRGVGRTLIALAANRARAEGGDYLYLTTFASIPWNGPFYARLGFFPLREDEAPPFVADILAAERAEGFTDRIAMRLPL